MTKAPELRTTPDGTSVCNFNVAVNGKKDRNGNQKTDYFRVTTWRELGENCAKFLDKGKKVAVVGPVSYSTYVGNDGAQRVQLEILANEVEFLSPKGESAAESAPPAPEEPKDPQTGFTQVSMDDDELPF